jgi:hypothetical protein
MSEKMFLSSYTGIIFEGKVQEKDIMTQYSRSQRYSFSELSYTRQVMFEFSPL